MKFTLAFILAAAVAVCARPVEPVRIPIPVSPSLPLFPRELTPVQCASLDCTPNSAGTEEPHAGMLYGLALVKAAKANKHCTCVLSPFSPSGGVLLTWFGVQRSESGACWE